MRLALALGLSALFTGCMPQAVVGPGKAPRENISSAMSALGKSGYRCEPLKGNNIIACEQEETKIAFVLGLEEMPFRIVIAMRVKYETECDAQRLVRMNQFHDRVDFAIATCREKSVTLIGSYVLPEHGLTAKDLAGYIRWWTRATLQAAESVGLFDDEGSGSKPGGKPKESDPASDGTKT